MKKLMLVLALFFTYASTYAYVLGTTVEERKAKQEIQQFDPAIQNMNMDAFLEMTPKKYKEMTGKKLGIKNTIKMKFAQKRVKKLMKKSASGGDISPGLYVLLAILGVGWVAMGVLSDWSGSDWIINLVLYILCYLPGLIHALVKKKDYY